MSQDDLKGQPGAREPARRHVCDHLLGDLVSYRVVRSKQQRHADVMYRPESAILARLGVRARFEMAAKSQVGGIGVIGCEIEVAIEGERVSHDFVMRLVAGACIGSVRDQSPE